MPRSWSSSSTTLPLLLLLLLSLLLHTTLAAPAPPRLVPRLLRQEEDPNDNKQSASAIPIPDVDPGDQPQGPEATPTATATAEPSVVPSPAFSPVVSVSPGAVVPIASPSPPIASPNPSPTDDVTAAAPPPDSVEGRGARGANVASGIITLLLFLFAFLAFIALAAAGRRDTLTDRDATVYTTAAAKPPPPSAEKQDLTEAVYTSKDEAREQGPAAGLAVAPPPSDEDDGDGGGVVATLPRGPTPPPHDYVLGAGPAATRTDFVELRTKFERDEIGDNSAVLGVAGAGVGEGVRSTGGVAEEKVVVAHPPAPVPVVTAEEKAEKEGLPDRTGGSVPVTFDSQERLMAGGDGSGAISDAALSLNAASIVEESADVPSLERDPIQVRRERDETY